MKARHVSLVSAVMLAGCGMAPPAPPSAGAHAGAFAPSASVASFLQVDLESLARIWMRNKDADRNADGVLSATEIAAAGCSTDFVRTHDADADGAITAAELAAAQFGAFARTVRASAKDLTAACDQDHDGRVTIRELEARHLGVAPDELQYDYPALDITLASAFAIADRDHDGRLSRAEVERMCSHLAGKANVFTVSHPVDKASHRMPPLWQS